MNQQYKNPSWWSRENESAWQRVKLAMKRDWDQTKHDLGGHEPDTYQSIGHTARQALGTETVPARGTPAYEEVEPAHRFGHGARLQYGEEYPEWDDELESHLRQEWEEVAPSRKETWMQDRAAIRNGWYYEADDWELDDED